MRLCELCILHWCVSIALIGGKIAEVAQDIPYVKFNRFVAQFLDVATGPDGILSFGDFMILVSTMAMMDRFQMVK